MPNELDIAAILGLKPDETTVRGSRITAPKPIPTAHRWKIVCRESGLRIDEQIARVLERLAPHTTAIATLARRLDSEEHDKPSTVLQVVRYFNDEPDQQDPPTAGKDRADSPNMFGWHVGREVLDFLHTTGAVLDIDEYDMTPDYADEEPAPESRASDVGSSSA